MPIGHGRRCGLQQGLPTFKASQRASQILTLPFGCPRSGPRLAWSPRRVSGPRGPRSPAKGLEHMAMAAMREQSLASLLSSHRLAGPARIASISAGLRTPCAGDRRRVAEEAELREAEARSTRRQASRALKTQNVGDEAACLGFGRAAHGIGCWWRGRRPEHLLVEGREHAQAFGAGLLEIRAQLRPLPPWPPTARRCDLEGPPHGSRGSSGLPNRVPPRSWFAGPRCRGPTVSATRGT